MSEPAATPGEPPCLLDVAPLLALLWQKHEHHERATLWQTKARMAVCPLTELGFLRISTQPAFGATFAQAKRMLRDWKEAKKPGFIPCDLEALDMDDPTTGKQTTDFYLASLAQKHGMRLATLDENIGHKAAYLIPP
jgi:predicted nucleic acid-binding protein